MEKAGYFEYLEDKEKNIQSNLWSVCRIQIQTGDEESQKPGEIQKLWHSYIHSRVCFMDGYHVELLE